MKKPGDYILALIMLVGDGAAATWSVSTSSGGTSGSSGGATTGEPSACGQLCERVSEYGVPGKFAQCIRGA